MYGPLHLMGMDLVLFLINALPEFGFVYWIAFYKWLVLVHVVDLCLELSGLHCKQLCKHQIMTFSGISAIFLELQVEFARHIK